MILLAKREGWTPNALADTIEKSLPAYKTFADWLRRHPWFMTLGAAIIAPVLTVLLTHWINHPGSTYEEINNVVRVHLTVECHNPPSDH